MGKSEASEATRTGLDVIDSGNKTRLDLWPSSDLVADCVWLAAPGGGGKLEKSNQSRTVFHFTARDGTIPFLDSV